MNSKQLGIAKIACWAGMAVLAMAVNVLSDQQNKIDNDEQIKKYLESRDNEEEA